MKRWTSRFAGMLAIPFACSHSDNGNENRNQSMRASVCTDARRCPKSCTADQDCETAQGQVCCDFGTNFPRACVPASFCAHEFCHSDADCATDLREACCRVEPFSNQKACSRPFYCLRDCQSNADCLADGFTCSTIFREPFCLSTTAAPMQCSTSADCDGRVCCTENLEQIDPTNVLADIDGLCSDTCLQACTNAQDCSGQICCDGFCRSSCPRKCGVDTDCRTEQGELCCANNARESPWWNSRPPRGWGG